MGIGNRIKEARNHLGYTQEELAKLLGVTKGAVANYELETSHPKESIMYKLIEILKVDANYLFQDCVNIPCELNNVTPAELDLIKKYRFISQHASAGTEIIDTIINREYTAAAETQEQKAHIAQLEAALQNPSAALRIYAYMHKIAAAGTGFYFDDIPTDTIEAPYFPDADFIVGVNGNSMEPTFSDGDLVYVHKCQIIENGEIGIFSFHNQCLIKEAGENGLISHNPKYNMIPGSSDIICIGKVLGKVNLK